MKVVAIVILLCSFLVSSCALTLNGTRQRVTATSHTPKSKVHIHRVQKGSNYATQKVSRSRDHIATVGKKRCVPQPSFVESKKDYGWKVPYLFLTPFALVIDLPTGSWKSFRNNNIVVSKLQCNVPRKETPVKKIETKKSTSSPVAKSDIDQNIPKTNVEKKYAFALIVGNEDYQKYQQNTRTEQNVEFAHNDAETFKKYANLTLGIPEENITLLKDATSVQLKREIEKLSKFAQKSKGQAELYFYYAGHGYPCPKTQLPYLIPPDVIVDNIEDGVRLAWVYQTLTKYPVQRTTVFLDACFSGYGRNMGLVATRGLKVQVKPDAVQGNIVVFAASKEDQPSLPYREKQHGMFTYHLLKKLQKSKGKVTYGELSEYVTENVSLDALRRNNKEQDPNVLYSPEIEGIWEQWTF
ncbi:MAG: caspase family protein [Prevotellaceae bacterium]|jgi:hypothetical protein|nr:caspase family protein [Prevotellaceae bacterium]